MGRVVLIASLLLAGPVLAQASYVIPYQGHLERDGSPVSSSAAEMWDMRFELWRHATSTDPGDMVWADEYADVTVAGGRFSVKLGSGAQLITDTVLGAYPLYIDVAVRGPTDASFVPLSGRQAMLYVPFAAATGALDPSGDQHGGQVAVSGAVVFADRFGPKLELAGSGFVVGVEPSTLVFDASDQLAWRSNGSEIMRAGPSLLTVNVPTTVGGDLSVDGTLTVNGGLACQLQHEVIEYPGVPVVASFWPERTRLAEIFQYGWICWNRSGVERLAPTCPPGMAGCHEPHVFNDRWDVAFTTSNPPAELCGRINYIDYIWEGTYLVHAHANYYYGLRRMRTATGAVWHGIWANGGNAGESPSAPGDNWTIWICR